MRIFVSIPNSSGENIFAIAGGLKILDETSQVCTKFTKTSFGKELTTLWWRHRWHQFLFEMRFNQKIGNFQITASTNPIELKFSQGRKFAKIQVGHLSDLIHVFCMILYITVTQELCVPGISSFRQWYELIKNYDLHNFKLATCLVCILQASKLDTNNNEI